jgi:hypothetical protein
MTTFLSISGLPPVAGVVSTADFGDCFAMTGSLGAGRAKNLGRAGGQYIQKGQGCKDETATPLPVENLGAIARVSIFLAKF